MSIESRLFQAQECPLAYDMCDLDKPLHTTRLASYEWEFAQSKVFIVGLQVSLDISISMYVYCPRTYFYVELLLDFFAIAAKLMN